MAGAYAIGGKTEVVEKLVGNLNTDVEDYQDLSYTFGSGLRDRAMILETLLSMDEQTQAATLVKDISEQLSSQRWFNTQALSYSLLAIGKFCRRKRGE